MRSSIAKSALSGKHTERQRSERTAAHGVNVAESVRRGDLPEDVRVVDDGREEIDRLDQRLIGRDLIHSGVVGVVEADQNIGVVLPG